MPEGIGYPSGAAPAESSRALTPPPQERRMTPQQERAEELKRQVLRIQSAGGSEADVLRFLRASGIRVPPTVTMTPDAEANDDEPVPGMLKGVSMAALQGVTFGFGDEAIGAIIGAVTGKGADAGIDEYRRQLRAFRDENPVISGGAELLGGIAVPGLGAAKLLQSAVRSGRMLPRIAMAAAEGAAGGALAGAGNAEGGITDRTRAALIGGAAGALLAGGGTAAIKTLQSGPGASSLVGSAIGGAAGGVPGMMAGAVTGAAASELGQELSRAGVTLLNAASAKSRTVDWFTRITRLKPDDAPASLHARQMLREALERDGLPISVAAREADRLHSMGVPATVVDLGGRHTAELFEAASKSRAPEVQKMVDDIMTRQDQAGPRILGQLFRSLRVGVRNARDAADELIAQRSVASRPLYRQAFQAHVPVTSDLKRLLTNPRFQEAYTEGRAIAVQEDFAGIGTGPAVPPLALSRDGEILNELLPVRSLDYVKKGLDNVIANAGKEGRPPLDRRLAVALRSQLNEALDQIGKDVPVYGQARQVWADNSRLLDALARGRGGPNARALTGSGKAQGARFTRKPPEIIRRELAALKTPAEKEFYRLGALQDIEDVIHSRRVKVNDAAREVFGGTSGGKLERMQRQQVRALFEDAAEADRFFDMVQGEAVLSSRSEAVTRTASARQLHEQNTDVPIHSASMAATPLRQMVGGMYRAATSRARNRWSEEVAHELSALGTRGIGGRDELLAMLDGLESAIPRHNAGITVVAGATAGGSIQ